MSTVIAFSGIDGSGKSTYIDFIEKKLKKKGFNAFQYDPMNSGKYNKELKNGSECLHNDELYSKYSSDMISVTFALDLMDEMEKIKKKGDIVLVHRHTLCCEVCASLYSKKSKTLKKILEQIETPDLLVYLDVDVNIALQRINRRGRKKTKKETKEKLLASRREYLRKLKQVKSEIVIINTDTELIQNKESLMSLEKKILEIFRRNNV